MTKLHLLLLAVSVSMLTACNSTIMASRLSRIAIGFDRANVIAVLGEPVSTSAVGQIEILNYQLPETSKEAEQGVAHRFIVRLVNSKVEMYGRPEDLN